MKKSDVFRKENQQKILNFNRLAVVVLFFVSGFMYASILARLPEMQRIYSVTNGQLGAILLCSSFGALTAMLGASRLIQRFSSANLATLSAVIFCLVIPLMPFVPSITALIPLFFALGATVGLLDVAMNAEAVRIEQAFDKPLMSSFHAVYSMSGAAGAGLSVLAAELDLKLAVHFFIVSALSLLVLVVFVFLRSKYPLSKMDDKVSKQAMNDIKSDKEVKMNRLVALKVVFPFALITFCSMGSESALSNWSAIYMNKIVGTTEAKSTWGFAIFATAMTIGRLLGDYSTKRFGQRKQLIFSGLLALLGLAIALFSTMIPFVLLGFFTTGLGLATIVPIAFSLAGNTEGVAEGVAVSMVSLFGYASFFILPPTLGYLSDAYSLKIVLIVPLGLMALLLFLVQKWVSKNNI